MIMASCEPQDTDSAQQQMVGTWEYIEDGTGYACKMQISAEGSDGLRISNFACLQLTVSAILVDGNSLIIPYQTVSGDKFEGSGTIRKFKTMTLSFTYDDGREINAVTATCTKQ